MILTISLIALIVTIAAISASSNKKASNNKVANKPQYERKLLRKAKELLQGETDEKRKQFLQGFVSKYTDSQTELYEDNDLDERQTEAFKSLYDAYTLISKSNKIWYIKSRVTNTEHKSSAAYTVDRILTNFSCLAFNNVHSSVNDLVPQFKDDQYTYYIYARFIVKARNAIDFTMIPLNNVRISFETQRFIEDEPEILLPKDGTIIDYTYRKVNKNGTPDLRFANNKRLPVYQYGKIIIQPLELTFHISDANAALRFVEAFSHYQQTLGIYHHEAEETPFYGNTLLDPLFDDAARLIVSKQQASTSLIQRKLMIGYNRAGRIMDQLEKAGIVGPVEDGFPRQILVHDLTVLEALLIILRPDA